MCPACIPRSEAARQLPLNILIPYGLQIDRLHHNLNLTFAYVTTCTAENRSGKAWDIIQGHMDKVMG